VKAEGRLTRAFFDGPPEVCAEALLGCILRWWRCGGIVVETEAYAARGDDACHTARRPGARAFLAAHPPGAAYVYFNYGMHWMLNVRVGSEEPGFVLLRALEPTHGLGHMRAARNRTDPRDLCSGPGKLARALGVNKSHHGLDLCTCPQAGFLMGKLPPHVKRGPRIGISSARDLPWRFWADGNPHVSTAGGASRKNAIGRTDPTIRPA
jgi:DNA-3-methyladenine glycosylase